MFFLTRKMEEELTDIVYDEGYEDGYNDGYKDAQLKIAEKALDRANRALEGLEDDARRLEQVYTWAYNRGAEDAMAKIGVIDIDEIIKEYGENSEG